MGPKLEGEKPVKTTQTIRLQVLIVAFGLVTLVLLAFTDRKALIQEDPTQDMAREQAPPPSQTPEADHEGHDHAPELTLSQLQPLPENSPLQAEFSKLRNQLDASEDKTTALKALIAFSEKARRRDFEALYLHQLASISGTAEDHFNAGKAMADARRIYMAGELNPQAATMMSGLARINYEKAMQLDPENAYAKIGYAVSIVQGQAPMQGIQLLKQILEDYKTDNEVVYRANLELGAFSLQTKQMEKALIRFEACIQAKPDFFEGYYRKGVTYQMMNDHEKANVLLKKAVSLAPNPEYKDEIAKLIKE